jgi:histidyl-tRNA synthetase
MPSAVRLRTDFTASELRRLAKKAKDANQSRRLLSLNGRCRRHEPRRGGHDGRHGPPDPS